MHLLAGRVYRAKGHLDQAVYHLTEAIHQAPKQLDPYLELGKVYQDRRDQTQALEIYRQATEVTPEDRSW